MKIYRYVFRNNVTGETANALSYSLRPAARSLGIEDLRGNPWHPWECWDGKTCLWHYRAGACITGPRQP